MNAWILLLGITLLIIGIFLATIGGIEKFSLEREDNLWFILFILGMVIIIFSIGFIIYAYIIDKKSIYNPYKEMDNYWNISVRWPTNLTKTPETKVVTIQEQSLGRLIEPVISQPLKVKE